MNNLRRLIFISLLLGLVYCDSPPSLVEGHAIACPQLKCRSDCGKAGYVVDENGCQTCKCVAKVECSRVMCRMYCEHGFQRDENGCEFCACNRSPQPCPVLSCDSSCTNGYRKDYSGCQTCECLDEPKDKCKPISCNLDCKNGLQRDESGCSICACNRCPQQQCRMFCMYGFKKNDEGCETCECDWAPVTPKVQCDERIPCPETRICNLNLKLCETVNPERVNWFLYDFEVKSELFNDEKYVQTFKNGLIHNIAAKYGLEVSQIAVSSVEGTGLSSFHIMPYFNDDPDIFERKMDQIDIDLNTHEFRSVLPAVAHVVEEGDKKTPPRVGFGTWCTKFKNFIRSKFMFLTTASIVALIALIVGIGYINNRYRYAPLSDRSDSKAPIYEPNDEHSYPVETSDDMKELNDKRVYV